MAALTSGEEFAGYVVERVLATGGMGEVYLARHSHLGRVDAVKVMRSLTAGDAAMRARFLREGQLAASLRHPNVVTIYTAGEWEGRLYLAMEYIQGSDLRAEIDRHERLVPSRAVWILGQAAAALDAAHEHGLVHRDVKPANILLSHPERAGGVERVLLTDFGITKSTTSETGLTGLGEILGTLDYIAPEQIEGKSLDTRVDVYALGCVLYECLVGRPPFRGESTVAMLNMHLSSPTPRPSVDVPGVPAGFDAVVAKAMAKDREDRYATCGELAAAAAAVVPRKADTRVVHGVGPAANPPVVPLAVPREVGSRSRRPVVLAVVGMAVALAAAGVALSGGSGDVDKTASGSTPSSSSSQTTQPPGPSAGPSTGPPPPPGSSSVSAAWGAVDLSGLATAWPTIVTAAPGVASGSGPTCRPRESTVDRHADGVIACSYANGVDLELLHYPTPQARVDRRVEVANLATTQAQEQWTGSARASGNAYRRDSTDSNGVGPYRWWSFDFGPTYAMFATWPQHSGAELSAWWRGLPDRPVA